MAFSTTDNSGAHGPSSEINVTPLIDVLLVLLIIFMVIVPVMPLGLKATLPSMPAANTVDELAEQPVLVQVEQGSSAVRYRIDGSELDRGEVASRLTDLLAQRSIRRVLVKADARLEYGVIAGVIDAGQAAGAVSISLITPAVEEGPK